MPGGCGARRLLTAMPDEKGRESERRLQGAQTCHWHGFFMCALHSGDATFVVLHNVLLPFPMVMDAGPCCHQCLYNSRSGLHGILHIRDL